jgi:glycosyltransferase involved in cell wall biosynthesis
MRIGVIAPPFIAVPPPPYGGTEAVVNELSLAYQRAGHEVVLHTTGDATCAVTRRWTYERAQAAAMGQALPELAHVMAAYEALADVDIIHDHTLVGPAWAKHRPGPPVVTTVHNPLDAERAAIYRRLAPEVAVVAISTAQREAAPEVPVARVIHHGLDATRWQYGGGNGGYMAFLGRMSPDKGGHRAVEVATRLGLPLIIAAKAHTDDERAYLEERVRPGLDETIFHVGEVGGTRKWELLANARCLVFPIRWNEPFGMVMLEAMACGTPVVAFAEGAAVEVIDHGRTGFVCADEDEMAKAVVDVIDLDRMDCRAAVEGYFSADRMAGDYIELFEHILARAHRHRPAA